MPLKTVPFDGAEHLESQEGQIELLADAASTGDATYIRHVLDVVARARGMTDIAREAGISRRVLFDAILDEEKTGVDALLKIFRALGAAIQDTTASAAE